MNSAADLAAELLRSQPAYFARNANGRVELQRVPGTAAELQALDQRTDAAGVARLARNFRATVVLGESYLGTVDFFMADATNWPIALLYKTVLESWDSAVLNHTALAFVLFCSTTLMARTPKLLNLDIDTLPGVKDQPPPGVRVSTWLNTHLIAPEAVYRLCFARLVQEPLSHVSNAKEWVELWKRFKREVG
ncbi:hypothetical protein JCM10207_005199 [Rhodosporidiobolus poonsookiae]